MPDNRISAGVGNGMCVKSLLLRIARWETSLKRSIGPLLSLITLLCYSPISQHDFINFDDPAYLHENSHVTSGLTWAGVVWAFRTGYFCSWHPLTWISHMLDCQLYGLNPGGHHL